MHLFISCEMCVCVYVYRLLAYNFSIYDVYHTKILTCSVLSLTTSSSSSSSSSSFVLLFHNVAKIKIAKCVMYVKTQKENDGDVPPTNSF